MLQESWDRALANREGASDVMEVTFTDQDILWALSAAREGINAAISPKHGVSIPELNVDILQLLEALGSVSGDGSSQDFAGKTTDATSGGGRRKGAKIVTPAWTGLAVRKCEAAVASMRSATINRHGGGSSKLTRGKQKREKPQSLAKDGTGKRRTT